MSALSPAAVLASPSLQASIPATAPRARVLGAGPTGALAALALAEVGWLVSLVDPLSDLQLRARSRAYALSHSSRLLLQRLGLWGSWSTLSFPFARFGSAIWRRVTRSASAWLSWALVPRLLSRPRLWAGSFSISL